MPLIKPLLFTAVAGLLLTATAVIAQPKQRVSTLQVTTARYDTGHISVYYSSPSVNDPKTGEPRQIWGGVVPFDQVWRTGANEATLLVTQNELHFGDDLTLPAGAYSLYSLPTEDGLTLIFNSQVGQWGSRYDESKDVARLELEAKTVETPAERLTISLDRVEKTTQGTFTLSWADRSYVTSFTYGEVPESQPTQ